MVFLFGPPAVGKLTIGRFVAERLGFRLLHNHATVDAVLPVFDFGTEPFKAVLRRIRLDLIGTAAAAGVDLVVTFVVTSGEEAAVDELVAPYAGHVTYVRLVASDEELRRRVVLADRASRGKIIDAGLLDEILQRDDFDAAIVGREALTLDTEAMSPEEAAERVAEVVA